MCGAPNSSPTLGYHGRGDSNGGLGRPRGNESSRDVAPPWHDLRDGGGGLPRGIRKVEHTGARGGRQWAEGDVHVGSNGLTKVGYPVCERLDDVGYSNSIDMAKKMFVMAPGSVLVVNKRRSRRVRNKLW